MEYKVESVDADGNCKLRSRILHYESLSSSVEWVLFLELLFALAITLSADASNPMDVGVADIDAYSPTVRKISEIPVGKAKKFRTTAVDRFFYRFPTVSGAQEIEWGEHEPIPA